MSDKRNSNNELTMGECPGNEVAIQNWVKARSAFQNNRAKEHRDNYMLRCDELGQSIGAWAKSDPELAYEYGNWFKSHRTDWAL